MILEIPVLLTDERGDNRPEIVVRPAKADDDEQLPLVPTHPNVLDLRHVSFALS
jgi:hypothetical protein